MPEPDLLHSLLSRKLGRTSAAPQALSTRSARSRGQCPAQCPEPDLLHSLLSQKLGRTSAAPQALSTRSARNRVGVPHDARA